MTTSLHRPPAPAPAATLRQRVAAASWRRRVAASRLLDHAYRAGVAVVGGAVVAVGLVTVPLPGPGWLTVLAGLVVLSSEFSCADRLLTSTRRFVGRWTQWLARQRLALRLTVTAGSVAVSGAALVVTLQVLGVPPWVPDALQL